MRIIELQAKDFMRLTAVRIPIGKGLTEITGANGAGKTCVLEIITGVLGGKKGLPATPIRIGQKRSVIGATFQDDGDMLITIERVIRKSGSSELVVTDSSGVARGSPQKFCDELLHRLAHDPLAFSRMKPAEQAETLRQIIGLDVSDLDTKEEELAEARLLAGRELRDLEARFSAAPGPHAAPAEPVDIAELADEFEAANKAMRENIDKRNLLERRREDCEDAKGRVERIKRELAEAELTHKNAFAVWTESDRDVAALIDPDHAAIQLRLIEAETTNDKVRENAARKELATETEQSRARHERHDAEIDAVREQRRARIAAVKMPIDGLAIEDGVVVFKGVPYAQASSAERLRVATSLCVASDPKLRLIRIEDGSLLDAEGLAALGEIADENDFQIIVERVAGDSPTGIVIEDGEVVSA